MPDSPPDSKKFDVITIGSATVDVFLKSRQFKIIEKGPLDSKRAECFGLGSKIEIEELTIATGGGATNAAVSLARKGFRTAPVTVVGNDLNGREVLNVLKHERVGVDFLHINEHYHTGYAIILVTDRGDRSILVHRGASQRLESSLLAWNDYDSAWFYISSLGGNMPIVKAVMAGAAQRGVRVVFNPGSRELKKKEQLLPLLPTVDILLLNREEGALLTGAPYAEEEKILAALVKLLAGAGAHTIAVLTDAQRGVAVADGERIYRAGIFPEKKVADRTGAGDAFGSGFLAGFLRSPTAADHERIPEAIRIGSANATSVIEHLGAKQGLLRGEELAEERWQELEVHSTNLDF